MDYDTKNIKELIALCKEKGIKGYSNKRKEDIIALLEKGPQIQKTQKTQKDPVTQEALTKRYYLLKGFAFDNIKLDKEFDYHTRRDGLPEHVSENIIKFIIMFYLYDPSCTWACDTGDLHSLKDGKTECKCFTSDGPISFGPKQSWNIIYFLDARGWLEDVFVLWQVNLPNTHEIWKKIIVKKGETKDEQSEKGRRPRINWDALYPQIKDHCKKVYEGSFDGIFTNPQEAKE